MQTKQRSLTTRRKDSIHSPIYQKNDRSDWQAIKQTHNIRIFKSSKKIGQILRNPKNKRPPFSSAGAYKIPCFFGQIYIGETRRIVNLRIKEPTWCQAKHVNIKQESKKKQDIKFEKTTTIDNSPVLLSYFPSIEKP